MIFISDRRADGGVAVVGASPPTVESRQHPPINSLGPSETLDPSRPTDFQKGFDAMLSGQCGKVGLDWAT